jgi:hypothetical protein
MMRLSNAVLGCALLLAVPGSPLHGQAPSGTMPARATVETPPITGAGIQGMDFGSMQPGDVVDVPPGSTAATGRTSAAWRFSGIRKGRTIVWTLALPAALLRGSTELPVDWDNTGYGTTCVAVPDGACALSATFNPAAGGGSLFIPNPTPGNNFDVTIHVGARATVPPVPPGVYTAQATLYLAYLL